MLQAILIFAAEAVEKEQHNYTPFYIAAGLLAAFGFLVGILGTVRAGSFPDSDRAARPLIGLCALLVVATMATAVLTG